MWKIFTTPTIMQKYLVDPITYRFTSNLKEIYPNPVFAEDYDSLLLAKNEKVVNSLRKVMKSYNGFKFRRSGDSYVWYHPMKSTPNYTGSMLVISLTDNGNLYRFSTHIVLGKKKRNCYVMTAFGYLAALSVFLLAGFFAGLELDLLTLKEFIVRAVICVASAVAFGLLESKFNPVFRSEEESN